MTLKDIATLYLTLGTNKQTPCQKIYEAISANPYLIGGHKRFDTEFIRVMNGRGISKGGGEGVIGLFVDTQKYGPIGMSIKIEDGNHRCRDNAGPSQQRNAPHSWGVPSHRQVCVPGTAGTL